MAALKLKEVVALALIFLVITAMRLNGYDWLVNRISGLWASAFAAVEAVPQDAAIGLFTVFLMLDATGALVVSVIVILVRIVLRRTTIVALSPSPREVVPQDAAPQAAVPRDAERVVVPSYYVFLLSRMALSVLILSFDISSFQTFLKKWIEGEWVQELPRKHDFYRSMWLACLSMTLILFLAKRLNERCARRAVYICGSSLVAIIFIVTSPYFSS
ncbi:unnamed protein product [Calypogeia fissa]